MSPSRGPRPDTPPGDGPNASYDPDAEVTLAHAVARTLAIWNDMTQCGQMSPQTRRSFGQLIMRYQHYAHARGVLTLHQVDAHLAEDFVFAQGRTRHGRLGDSATATSHQRRAVLRTFYRTLRELGLADTDPTRDLALPERSRSTVRPLTEDEAIAIRHAAEYVSRPSRHAAAAALALAGAHTGEIGHIRVRDLDTRRTAVWAHGSTRTDQRWCPLHPWALRILTARAAYVTRQQLDPARAPDAPLAVSNRPAADEQLQARACVALTDLIRRIGLGHDPQVKPASLTAHAGVRVFQDGGRIEDVARRLGLRSLDRAAAVIHYDWAHSHLPEDAARA
ncbi:site-specific integrase [Kitasatospora sp. NPDC048722]|uniref:site-specific integrase n=1 Tax=Kitasatospora sp. NPDC048722 TaxID=3155639 RepID=UPI0033FB67BF